MAVPEAGCGGEDAGVLMAVPDDGCGGGKRQGFPWQSKTLVVGGRCIGSHGSPRHWLWCGRLVFSWQSQTLVVGGQAGVLMAVEDTGCGRGEAGVLMAVPDAGCEGERQGFLWQSLTLVGGQEGGSHGSLRHWLCWGEMYWFSWQS